MKMKLKDTPQGYAASKQHEQKANLLEEFNKNLPKEIYFIRSIDFQDRGIGFFKVEDEVFTVRFVGNKYDPSTVNYYGPEFIDALVKAKNS